MSVKKIILTGSQGFLGVVTQRMLQSHGYVVVPCTVDLRKDDFLEKANLPSDAFAVVHLAGVIDFSPGMHTDMFRVNTLAAHALARFASQIGARFILASSVAAAQPSTPYGLSKWLAEELTKRDGERWTALRFVGIFGRGGGTHLGLNKALADALTGNAPTLAGDGAGKRNYLFVDDAALAIAHVLDRDLDGLHIVAGTETLSIQQMLTTLCEELLTGASPVHVAGTSSADQLFVPSPDLPPTRTFRQALRDLKQAV